MCLFDLKSVVGKEQARKPFASLVAEVWALLCIEFVGCEEGDRGLVIYLCDISIE